MIEYNIVYEYKNKFGSVVTGDAFVGASNLTFAKRKLMRKHKVKSIKILRSFVVGYF